jgi:hypothetical protein
MAYPTYRENYQCQWQQRRNLRRANANPQVHYTGKETDIIKSCTQLGVAYLLRRCAASRKVTGSSPDEVDFFKLT